MPEGRGCRWANSRSHVRCVGPLVPQAPREWGFLWSSQWTPLEALSALGVTTG